MNIIKILFPKRMKIAFFQLEDWESKVVREKLKGHKLEFFKGSLSLENVGKIKNFEAIAVFIYSKLERDILEKLPRLKLITAMSTGFDHIDIEYCNRKKIVICNVPSYGENTVAEHTFSLILALSRRLYNSIKRTHEQHSFETDASLRGFDLKGKTIGIIGCGNIGKHVARISVGFQMNVIVYDRHKNKELAKSLMFKYVGISNLLKNSDIITLHTPYTKENHHLINKKSIQKMKDGVYIINTARGALIDTHALIENLESGKISGAALDVLEGELEIKEEMEVLKKEFKAAFDFKTILEDHMLMKMENVIITPHNAFNSWEALNRILETTIENIISFKDSKPKNVVLIKR